MLITCACPTRDRPRYIPLLLASFTHQDWPELELLILDNGEQSIQHLLPPDPRITYQRIPPPHLTLGALRNLCAELAHGEIIVQFDDDDAQGPHRVSHQAHQLTATRQPFTGYHEIIYYSLHTRQPFLWSTRTGYPYPPGCSMAYLRAAYLEHPCPDTSFSEDYHFWAAVRRANLCTTLRGDHNMVALYHQQHAVRTMPPRCSYPPIPRTQLPPWFDPLLSTLPTLTTEPPH
jgi:glycosyltransferase involved in cell wall biosynthesis